MGPRAGLEPIPSKKKIAQINRLYDAIKKNAEKDFLAGVFDELIDYAATHHAYEEDLFKQTNYPEAEAHCREHREKKEEYKANPEEYPLIDLIVFLCEGWKEHIQQTDMKYKEHLKAHGLS